MQVSNRRRWGGLAVLSLALAIIIIDTTLINVSLRTMVKDLNTTLHSLQWVITGYALTLTAFMITGGRMGDLFGRKKLFMLGAITFAAGSTVAATSHSVTQLIIGASVIEGLGAAMMMPATSSLLLATFHGRERAIAFGVWGGVAGAAATVGPLLGGYLTTYYSWRWGYTINIGIVAILLLSSWLIVESRETDIKRPTVDYIGILLSGLGLASIVYGIVESSTYGWFHAKTVSEVFGRTVNLGNYSFVPFAIAFGIMLLIMFVMWEAIVENRGKTPLVSLRLFANSKFMAGGLTMAIMALGQFGTIFALPVFFQAVRGLDAFHNGLAFLPFSLTTLVAAPLAGALGSRFIPPKFLIVTGLIIDAVGLYWVRQTIGVDTSVRDLYLPFITFGFGFGIAFAQIANLTLSAVSVQEAGEASGVNNTFRQLGATLGNAIIGSILLAALATNIQNDISASDIIPAKLKPRIETGAAKAAQSLGENKPAEAARLPANVSSELNRIQNQATADAVHKALGYGVWILALGAVVSLRMPRSAPGQHGHGDEEPEIVVAAPMETPLTPVPEAGAAAERAKRPRPPRKRPVQL